VMRATSAASANPLTRFTSTCSSSHHHHHHQCQCQCQCTPLCCSGAGGPSLSASACGALCARWSLGGIHTEQTHSTPSTLNTQHHFTSKYKHITQQPRVGPRWHPAGTHTPHASSRWLRPVAVSRDQVRGLAALTTRTSPHPACCRAACAQRTGWGLVAAACEQCLPGSFTSRCSHVDATGAVIRAGHTQIYNIGS
jgi:hypothetical protein